MVIIALHLAIYGYVILLKENITVRKLLLENLLKKLSETKFLKGAQSVHPERNHTLY